MTRWVGYLNECVFLWPHDLTGSCVPHNPTTQHMCVDRAGDHDLPGHTCRCGRRLEPLSDQLERQAHRARRAARDARYPYDTPRNFGRTDDATQPDAQPRDVARERDV